MLKKYLSSILFARGAVLLGFSYLCVYGDTKWLLAVFMTFCYLPLAVIDAYKIRKKRINLIEVRSDQVEL